MEKFKKVTALLLVGMMIMGLAGCGSKGETAEQAVINMLDAVKVADQEKASKYIDYGEVLEANNDQESESDADKAKSEAMIKLVLKNLSYEVVSAQEDGDQATVETTVTNTDMSLVMSDVLSQAFALAFSGISESNMEDKMMDIFTNLLNEKDRATVTNTVKMTLKKEDGQWQIETNDELVDAILGGMLTYFDGMRDPFGSPSGDNKLSDIKNWLIADIWNKGFSDIHSYTYRGKDNTGSTMDIDFTMQQLDENMKQKAAYDNYIQELTGDQYTQVKQIWAKLSPEIDTLYAQLKSKPPIAEDRSTGLDTGKFSQYEEAFIDAVNEVK